ncbi:MULTISPECIES: hypothetical protein [unclassified Aureimonas]|uniref:hypothetical protein n=1 Tax=unclassified Aureimonas TaxID=2615206 RepID=UPI0012E39CA4|nr:MULTISPECIES: hypothetical protein [unclassified Aureimonas]
MLKFHAEESAVSEFDKTRSYRISHELIGSAFSMLRSKFVSANFACEAIGLFLTIADLETRSGCVIIDDLERAVGPIASQQDKLDALQSIGLISIQRASQMTGGIMKVAVAEQYFLEAWRRATRNW